MGSSKLHPLDRHLPRKTHLALAGLLLAIFLLGGSFRAFAQWTQTNGPPGGEVTCFASDGSTVYAGTASGVFYSGNAGATWLDGGLITRPISCLATNGTTVYAGTSNGVFSSVNRGTTWNGIGLGSVWVRSLAANGSKLYAGTFGLGVFMTSDGGSTWKGISALLPDSTIQALLPIGTGVLAGSSYGYIYRTTNDGSSWVDVSAQLTTVGSINVLYANGSTHYAATDDGVWRSTDDTNWTQIGLTGVDVVAFAASGSTLYAGSHTGCYSSTNGGSSWTPANNGLTSSSISALFASASTALAGTSNRGVFVTTNAGAVWAESNTGLIGNYVYALSATPPTGPQALFAGMDNGVAVSLDKGASWINLDIGFPSIWAPSLLLSDTTLFAGTNGAGVYRANLNSTTWAGASTGLPSFATVRSLVRVPPSGGSNPTLYAGLYGNGVYFSTNMGASWSAANIGLPPGMYVLALCVQTIGASTNLFAGSNGQGLYKSTNNGSNWTLASTGLPSSVAVASIQAIGTNLFAGTYGSGAYLSTDNGASWTAISSGLPPPNYVYSFAAVGNTVYAGVPGGIYATTNNGASWTLDSPGMTAQTVISFAVNGSTLFAGTTRGVWSASKTSYPATYALSTTVSFPQHTSIADFSTGDYRLVGLPGNPNTSVSSYLTGKAETNWRVSWDNGGTSNYLVRYDASATFNFTTGRAFWMINNGPVNISATVPTATPNANNEVEVPLHTGWNLVTDPFSAGVAWSRVQTYNGVTEPLFQYNGTSTYLNALSLVPYTGYYFFNATGASVLKIPLSFAGSIPAGGGADPAAWRVQVAVRDGDTVDSLASFGVFAGPAERAKALSYHKPRLMPGGVSVSFPRPDLDAQFSSFAADIRPVFQDFQEWPLEITAARGKAVTISFSNLRQVPSGFEAWLMDEQTGRAFDLRKESVYSFTSPFASSKFSVVIGRHSAIEARLASGRPASFALGRNFPNPFNPSTTIPVEVPQETEASVKIYSLLGAEVAVLHQGRLEAGRYWFTWDGLDHGGRSAATGAYLVRLQAGGKSFVSKILLLR